MAAVFSFQDLPGDEAVQVAAQTVADLKLAVVFECRVDMRFMVIDCLRSSPQSMGNG